MENELPLPLKEELHKNIPDVFKKELLTYFVIRLVNNIPTVSRATKEEIKLAIDTGDFRGETVKHWAGGMDKNANFKLKDGLFVFINGHLVEKIKDYWPKNY